MTERARKIVYTILALLVSTGAWFFVVYNYDPMTSVRYTGIPVTYTGLDTLANRGYAVSESNHEVADVTLQQRRIDTAIISADDISITADVSGLTTGENTVTLRTIGPEGTQVMDTSVKNITVEIESAASAEMPISVEYSEKTAENAEPIKENMSVENATVIATDARLAKIDRVAAVVDPDDLSDGLKSMTVTLAALDSDGNKVLNVLVYPETVSFRGAAGFTKEVRLVVPVEDGSDDSYERTYTLPETVTIKCKEGLADSYTGITANEIDISGYYEDSDIPITIDLPEGVYLADDQEELIMKLKVTEKTKEKDKE